MDHGGFWSCRTRSDASTGSVGCDGSDSANLRRRGHIASKGHGWLRYCSMIEAKEHETCGSLAHARHRGRFNADQYLKYDDDFQRSKSELGKILDQIRRLQSSDLDLDALMHLRVLCAGSNSALS